ncbi:uncharacterized protein LOC111364543 [Spodoptera litura]|nr:uncharacterized protein LOC111351628 [Spodoptera litura]XP_022820635.1 uncharacterized protein LOC111352390 [Spodoptera litura]XP_022829295.1 uncharacterized protein LOC111358407 [Spodoptera litura]XP_022837216.1 uncharacterized protein LOC111364543 [Spodoptera litura]
MLAFVCNKIDTLPETAIVQICLSAFTDADIESARQLVYKLLAPSKKIMRRKEGNQQKSVQEIVKIVKESDPDCLPIFVAKDLNKLPPVTFDHIDVTTFLKEMLILKKEVASLRRETTEVSSQAANEEMASIKLEIQQLKDLVQNALSTNASKNTQELSKTTIMPNIPSINIIGKEVEEIYSESIDLDFDRPPRDACDAVAARGRERARDSERVPSPTSRETAIVVGREQRDIRSGGGVMRSEQHIAAAREIVPAPSDLGVMLSADRRPYTMADAVKKTVKETMRSTGKSTNDEWSTVQYKRRKIMNRRGIAQPLEQFNFKAAERKISLYISRVHKDTTASNIEAFIKYKTDLEVQVFKINNVNNEFNAFKVIVPLSSVDLFLDDNGDRFWPADIVFRKFWERKQSINKQSTVTESMANTEPTQN